MQPDHVQWIPIGIAIGTVIVVPSAVWLARKFADVWHKRRVEVLTEVFVTREEFARQFKDLNDVQARQHHENQQALDALRMDGREREGRLAGMLSDTRKDVRDEARAMSEGVRQVHQRVDSVLAMLGNRRRP